MKEQGKQMPHLSKQAEKLQWHPAFFAGLQLELEEEADKLIFENEHQLGTKPKEIDVLVVKKQSSELIRKNLGRIFRKYNIFEYKSPTDSLSVNDFYMVYGYTCFFKADTPKEDEIRVDEISVTLVCSKRPVRLLKHLEEKRKLTIRKVEQGIYYLEGDLFPIQLILTTELSEKENLWLRSLNNDLAVEMLVGGLAAEHDRLKKNPLYKAVVDIVARANGEKWKEKEDMYYWSEAFEEVFGDMVNERVRVVAQDVAQGMAKDMAQGMAKDMAQGMAKDIAQGMAKDMAQGMAKDIAQGMAKDMAQKIAKEMVDTAKAEADAEVRALRQEVESLRRQLALA